MDFSRLTTEQLQQLRAALFFEQGNTPPNTPNTVAPPLSQAQSSSLALAPHPTPAPLQRSMATLAPGGILLQNGVPAPSQAQQVQTLQPSVPPQQPGERSTILIYSEEEEC